MAVLLELPDELRGELKTPLGPVYTDTDALLADAGEPVVAVGDIVTYHLLESDYRPAVAFIDGRTKREQVDPEVLDALGGFDHVIETTNPAATLTDEVLQALRDALDSEGTTLVEVAGEEDLVALPAVLAVPVGASVVYGQPEEGMVLATADSDARERVRELLDGFVGNHQRAYAVLDA